MSTSTDIPTAVNTTATQINNEDTTTTTTTKSDSHDENVFASLFHKFVDAITPVPDDDNKESTGTDGEDDNAVVKQTYSTTTVSDAVLASNTTTVTGNVELSKHNDTVNPLAVVFDKFVDAITPKVDDDVLLEQQNKQRDALLEDNEIVEGGIPKYLRDAMTILTPYQKQLITVLYTQYGQQHLFQAKYFNSKSPPSMRRQLAQQLESLDREYVDGGLVGCINNIRTLLNNSKNNINPLDGWEPMKDGTTSGKAFELGTKAYEQMEANGLPELGSVGFVLVAGGLGERLGYSGIKVWKKIYYTKLQLRQKYHSSYHLSFLNVASNCVFICI
jgi:hypothetical protein